MALSVGDTPRLTGNVTTLIWIAARSPRSVEQSLGYGAGRLDNGYWIALLKEQLLPGDFEFDGTTMRSGGRAGLPNANPAIDAMRPRVHEQVLQDRGNAGYQQLQQSALRSVKLQGQDRIAKVIPASRHDAAMAPNLQYPPGAGGLQWKILPPGKQFVIAAHIDSSGMASAPGFAVDIRPSAPYENRARLMRYLETA